MVTRLLLQKPERIEALEVVFFLALRLGRLGERALRVHVETTGSTGTGGEKPATQKPTACMRMTKCAAVMVSTVGDHRQLAQPWSALQPAYLNALGVPATAWMVAPQGAGQLAGTGQRKTHRDGERERGMRRESLEGRTAPSYGARRRAGRSSAGSGVVQVMSRQEQRVLRTALGRVCLQLVQGALKEAT
jgi:hypothetical protein